MVVGIVDHLVLVGCRLPHLLRLQDVLCKLIHVKEIYVGSPISLIGARDLLSILYVLDQSLSIDILKGLLGEKISLSSKLLILHVDDVLSRLNPCLLHRRHVIGSI